MVRTVRPLLRPGFASLLLFFTLLPPLQAQDPGSADRPGRQQLLRLKLGPKQTDLPFSLRKLAPEEKAVVRYSTSGCAGGSSYLYEFSPGQVTIFALAPEQKELAGREEMRLGSIDLTEEDLQKLDLLLDIYSGKVPKHPAILASTTSETAEVKFLSPGKKAYACRLENFRTPPEEGLLTFGGLLSRLKRAPFPDPEPDENPRRFVPKEARPIMTEAGDYRISGRKELLRIEEIQAPSFKGLTLVLDSQRTRSGFPFPASPGWKLFHEDGMEFWLYDGNRKVYQIHFTPPKGMSYSDTEILPELWREMPQSIREFAQH